MYTYTIKYTQDTQTHTESKKRKKRNLKKYWKMDFNNKLRR